MVPYRTFTFLLPIFASSVSGFRLPPSTRFFSTVDSVTLKADLDGNTIEKTSVFVGNLPIEKSEDELRSFFEEKVGSSISNVRVPIDRKTGGRRGFVYLDFIDQPSAENAVAVLAGSVCGERPMKVDLADPAKKNDSPRTPRTTREPQENSIYVGNLDFEVTEAELRSLVDSELGDAQVVKMRVAFDRETNRSKGFAHIDFASPDAAKKAVETLNTASLRGRQLRVNMAQRKEDRISAPRTNSFSRAGQGERTPRPFELYSVFIGNLAWDMTPDLVEEMLNDVLGPGLHKKVRLAVDRETGRSRGFGHIDFKDEESCQRAISELNGMEVLGRPLRVDHAQKKEDGAGGDRSSSRGRGSGNSGRKYDNETPENYGTW